MKRRAFLRGLGGAAGGFALAPALGAAAPAARNRVFDRLRDAKVDIVARGFVLGGKSGPGYPAEPLEVTLARAPSGRHAGRAGTLAVAATNVAERPDAVDLASALKLAGRGLVTEHRIGLDCRAWSRDSYVVLPGAVYAGNRFQSRRIAGYPPLLTERADIGPNVPPIVPDIPRLGATNGPSGLEIDATDLATPAVGVFLPAARTGVILMVPLSTADGRTTLDVYESDDRTRAGILAGTKFFDNSGNLGSRRPAPPPFGVLPRPGAPMPAPLGVPIKPGAAMQLTARLHVFDCADVAALFERLFALRKELTGRTALVHELPFSAAFARHEQRVGARWVEKPGFLAVGARDSAYTTWQTGWCGGLVSTLPLLAAGGPQSHERAAATIAFALAGGQARSGFFHGVSDGKTWTEDGFAAPVPPPPPASDGSRPPAPPAYKHARRWHLVRRTAETLTSLCKHIALLERRAELRATANGSRWPEACRAAADALVKLWERHKQLGQFVDIDSGELIVGGSTSAGLAPAGLALAATALKEPRYLQAAIAIGEHYHDRFVRAGLTCGGPGDALQAPDSESAAALLDSFMTLYEATRDRVWVDRARAAAHLLASWVVSYDTPAAGLTCAPTATRASGAVLWSAASRRGSPGYLVSSGDGLLRLYRATGDAALLELLRDTVHNLAQYLPGPAGEPGRSEDSKLNPDCARADAGRWLDPGGGVVPVDGVFDAIGLLAYTEVPGIYARTDTGFVFVFDHVTARVKERAPGRVVLAIANPTRVDATVRILSETAEGAAEPLRPGAVLEAQAAVVPAGGSVQVSVPPA
jgi:hypothetical protein